MTLLRISSWMTIMVGCWLLTGRLQSIILHATRAQQQRPQQTIGGSNLLVREMTKEPKELHRSVLGINYTKLNCLAYTDTESNSCGFTWSIEWLPTKN